MIAVRARGPGVAIVACLLLATAALGSSATPATAIARHAYLVPVLVGAARFGLVGGALTGIAVVLLAAPLVLPDVELTGLTLPVVDALLLYPFLVVGGAGAGAVFTAARRHRTRHTLAVDVQRALAARTEDLRHGLEDVRVRLARSLRAEVALVLCLEEDVVVVGGGHPAPESLVSCVLRDGVARFVRGTGENTPFRRAFAAPLVARGRVVGALAVERSGELGAEERRALMALGTDIGLALENGRLAAAQRRFNDELARRVSEATAQVVAVDRAKSAFVATASHELRTPLTAIQGFAELLATREMPAPESRRVGAIVAAEAARLARMVADLLDLARIERGLALVIRPVPLVVEPALGSALAIFRGERAHRLVVCCAGDLPTVCADKDAFDRILVNLVSNALKYSPAGTPVTVKARAVEDGVEFSVTDAGPGIPPAAIPHVFEPFYRAAGTAAPGTGIGLSVVKSLVEAHGGRAELSSTPGEGTCVRFVLPGPAIDCASAPHETSKRSGSRPHDS
jgi:signal transduction histidine kinase